MKLLYGGLSPFVRKVMIVAHEHGLEGRIERVPSPVNPLEPLASVIAVNPLGKIPALVLDDGTPLFGATVVAEYLDSLVDAPRFFPRGADRWTALRRNAQADGILEAGTLARVETLRPEDKRWRDWRRLQLLKVTNALDAFEAEAGSLADAERMTIGEVALTCALGWLDVRLTDVAWREGRPSLAAWFETMSIRPSIAATAPKLPT